MIVNYLIGLTATALVSAAAYRRNGLNTRDSAKKGLIIGVIWPIAIAWIALTYEIDP